MMRSEKLPGSPGQSAAYDAYYQKRALYWSFNVVGKARSFQRLCRRYGVPKNGVRVLDIGFGAGAMLFWFASDCTLAGLEFSQGAIDRVRREAVHRGCPNLDLRLWDAATAALPFPAASFDIVVTSHTLEHVPDDRAILREIRRVLAAEGLVIVMVPADDPSWTNNDHHARVYSELSIRAAIEAAGFTIVGLTGDHSVDNVFHRIEVTHSLERAPLVRSRLLGGLSLLCTLLPGCERWRVFGEPRNLGVVAVITTSRADQRASAKEQSPTD